MTPMTRVKRALLLPSYAGSGFGHISRCLALADELSRRDWTVSMILAGPHVRAVSAAGHEVFTPHFSARCRGSKGEPPAYTCIQDGNIQALRDGLTRPWRLRLAIAEIMGIVRRFRPDVLIGDISLLTWIVGQRAGLPVVQIVRSIMHPTAPRIIWWEEPPAGMVSPDARQVFNPVLERWNLEPIERAEDLLRGDLFLVPSIPELEPLPDDVTSTHYIGTLIHQRRESTALPPLPSSPSERPLIYVTLGGGAGPVGSHRFFRTVNAAFEGTQWSVIVSTGLKFSLSELPPAPSNLSYYQWVPGMAVIQRSDVVVFHGGYGTTMETVRFGVPSVVLPFHSEQESNGRRLEACGACRVLSPASATNSMHLVHSQWRYGEFATWVQAVSPLTPAALRESVFRVLEDPGYRASAMALGSSAATYQGAPAAVELIDRMT